MKRMTVLLLALVLFTFPGCNTAPGGSMITDADRSFLHVMSSLYACDTGDVMYFVGYRGNFLHYVDKETGISGFLCGRPECEHDSDECNAYVTHYVTALSAYDGRLYWVNIGNGTVYSAELDGTGRQTVREFDRELFPNTAYDMFYLFHRETLYLACVKGTIKDGAAVYSNYVCAFPLDPKEEPFVILDEELAADQLSTGFTTIQPYGDKLYIVTDFQMDDPEKGREETPLLFDFSILCWDAQTRELSTLYHDGESPIEGVRELWAMDDGMIFNSWDRDSNFCPIQKFFFETGEITELFELDASIGIADDFVAGSDYDRDANTWTVILKDFEGNTLVEDTYSVSETFDDPLFFGLDEASAYFYYNNRFRLDGDPNDVWTILAVALDGSGMRVLCNEEDPAV